MTDVELAYFAGLFDGEGCIHADVIKRAGGTENVKVTLVVSMTHQGSIERLHKAFGGSLHTTVPKNPKHRQYWTWHLPQRQTFLVLPLLLPYLVVKKEEALVAIELLSRIAAMKLGGGKCLPLDELNTRKALAFHIKQLKGRL